MATVNVPIITSTELGDTNSSANTLALRGSDGSLQATTFSGSALVSSGTIQGSVTTITTSTTAAAITDYRCNCASGAITLTMPLASLYPGLAYNVVKTDSSGNAVTISGASGTSTISSQWGRLRIVSDGTTWVSTN